MEILKATVFSHSSTWKHRCNLRNFRSPHTCIQPIFLSIWVLCWTHLLPSLCFGSPIPSFAYIKIAYIENREISYTLLLCSFCSLSLWSQWLVWMWAEYAHIHTNRLSSDSGCSEGATGRLCKVLSVWQCFLISCAQKQLILWQPVALWGLLTVAAGEKKKIKKKNHPK